MRKLLSIYFILLTRAFASAQSWIPVGNGINGYVNTLFVYDSVMYAGGVFTAPGNNIAQWNGSTWDSLGSGINNEVNTITNYKDNIYAGGWFSKAGGHSAGSIATWNGSNFANAGFNIEGGVVNALQVYGSVLYVAGTFDSLNNNQFTANIVLWDGSVASPQGTFPSSNRIYSMTVDNGTLCFGKDSPFAYVVGYNNLLSIYGNIGYDGFANPAYVDAILYTLTTCNGSLYVGGSFNTAAGSIHHYRNKALNIAVWDNDTAWTNVGLGINGTVYALTSYNNLLYAGGSFDSAGGIPANNIAVWNGTSWAAVGNGVNGPVYALAVFNGNLYAGGDFNAPGSGIAEYTGPLGINRITNNYSVPVYPNPNNGTFTVDMSHSNDQLGDLEHSPTIEVYNMLGEMVISENLQNTQGNNVITINKQSPGVYMYRILSSNYNLISSGKLLVE